MKTDPEKKLIEHVMRKRGFSKSRAIAVLKGSRQIRQAGRGLEPTAKGLKGIRRLGR